MRHETMLPRRSLRQRCDKSPPVYNFKKKRVPGKHASTNLGNSPAHTKQPQKPPLSQTKIKKIRSDSTISITSIKITGNYQVPVLSPPPPKRPKDSQRRESSASANSHNSLKSYSTTTASIMQPHEPSSAFRFFPNSKIAFIELPPPQIPLNRGSFDVIIDTSKCINQFVTLEFLHHPYGRNATNPGTNSPRAPTRVAIIDQPKIESPIAKYGNISVTKDFVPTGQVGEYTMKVYISRVKGRWEFGFEDEYHFEIVAPQHSSFPSHVLHVTGPQNGFGLEIGREVDGMHCGGPMAAGVPNTASPGLRSGSRRGSPGASSTSSVTVNSVQSPTPAALAGGRRSRRQGGLPPVGVWRPPFSHIGASVPQQSDEQQEAQQAVVRDRSPSGYSDVSSVSTLTEFTEVCGVDGEVERVGGCVVVKY